MDENAVGLRTVAAGIAADAEEVDAAVAGGLDGIVAGDLNAVIIDAAAVGVTAGAGDEDVARNGLGRGPLLMRTP